MSPFANAAATLGWRGTPFEIDERLQLQRQIAKLIPRMNTGDVPLTLASNNVNVGVSKPARRITRAFLFPSGGIADAIVNRSFPTVGTLPDG